MAYLYTQPSEYKRRARIGLDKMTANQSYNKTETRVTAASPYLVPKSVGNFGHLPGSEQHANRCV